MKQPSDPFAAILAQTDAHRRVHSCWAYPFGDGPALGVLAAAVAAKRILELGTALGYTSCWLAYGSSEAHIVTIERDVEHVQLARANIADAGFADRIQVHHGDSDTVLPTLESGYDIAFFDGYSPALSDLNRLRSLLRSGGLLISANLDLGGDRCAVRDSLSDSSRWLTSFMAEAGRTAVSVKLGDS
jgi:predicted O-methyltransferase YrrM